MLLKKSSLYKTILFIGSDNAFGMQPKTKDFFTDPRIFTIKGNGINDFEIDYLYNYNTQVMANRTIKTYNTSFGLASAFKKQFPFYENIMMLNLTGKGKTFVNSLDTNMPTYSLNVGGSYFNHVVNSLISLKHLSNSTIVGVVFMLGENCSLSDSDHIEKFKEFKTALFGKMAELNLKTSGIITGIISPVMVKSMSIFNSSVLNQDPDTIIINPTTTKDTLTAEYGIDPKIHFSNSTLESWMDELVSKMMVKIKAYQPSRNVFKIIFQILKTNIIVGILLTFAIIVFVILGIKNFIKRKKSDKKESGDKPPTLIKTKTEEILKKGKTKVDSLFKETSKPSKTETLSKNIKTSKRIPNIGN